MRSAPAVRVTVSGGPGWRAAVVALTAASAASGVFWLASHAGLPAIAAAGLALGLASAAAVAAGGRLRRAGPRMLAWDGAAWRLDGRPGTLDLAIDLECFVLLRWRPAAGVGGAAAWVPASARECGPAWHALRVALVADGGRARDGIVAT